MFACRLRDFGTGLPVWGQVKLKAVRVVINADVRPGGTAGGVEQFLMGLVYGLGRLAGPEEYIIVAHRRNTSWLKPYLGLNQKIVPKPRYGGAKALFRSALHPLRYINRVARKRLFGTGWLPESNGYYESLGGDIVHFPFQRFTHTALPAIFNPQDLQHRRLPEFYSPRQIAWRESTYPEACRLARAVVAPSQAVKDDLVHFYGIDPQKIAVIPFASPTVFYPPPSTETLSRVGQKYTLAAPFALYPAQTWKHKNHVRLLEALQLLRDRDGCRLNLICVGRKNEYWPTVESAIARLQLPGQVAFLGFIDSAELRALYHLAQFVVFPSLFEGGGLPVIEAFQEGVPVACSDIPALREYAGDAALKFDPTSVDSIASALLKISTNADLRSTLRKRGDAQIGFFTWERAARMYRVLYHKVAGKGLSQEDGEPLNGRELARWS